MEKRLSNGQRVRVKKSWFEMLLKFDKIKNFDISKPIYSYIFNIPYGDENGESAFVQVVVMQNKYTWTGFIPSDKLKIY